MSAHFKKSHFAVLLSLGVLLFSIGSVALFAAAPSGGYDPAETLDPDCAPGDTDCFVNIPTGGGSATATNGLQLISGDIGLGGTLTEDTNIDQDGFEFSILNGDYSFVSNNDPLGFGGAGFGITNNRLTSAGTSFVGAVDSGGKNVVIAGNFDFPNDILNGLLVEDHEVLLVSSDGSVESRINVRNDSVDIGSQGDINISGINGSLNGQSTFRIGDVNVPNLGIFPGAGMTNRFEGGSGDIYTQNMIMAEAVGFGGVPISQLGLANETTGNGAYFRTGDFGGLVLQMEIDTGQITGIGIEDGAIYFKIQDNATFSIPQSAGSSGYILSTNGAGDTSWIDPSGLGGGGSGPVYYAEGWSGVVPIVDNAGFLAIGDSAEARAVGTMSIGYKAGSNSVTSFAHNSVFFGNSAGQDAPGAQDSVFIGNQAGNGATSAATSSFIGYNSGLGATNAISSNFVGFGAGQGATNANASNFMGEGAGRSATGASYSNFIGIDAGRTATGAIYSNFMGIQAGSGATNATSSSFIGGYAGLNAINAQGSVFLGHQAGSGATNANASIFIGSGAGLSDVVNNNSGNEYSILIGNSASTGGFSNSVALGYNATNTAENQFMIGSTIRPIEEMRIILDNIGGECVIDITGANCSSDETLKTDISDISNALDIVTQLSGVTYHWVNGEDGAIKTPGFIAQDVKDILPEAVRYNENTGKYMMNYTQIIPYLVEAVKTLNVAVNNGTMTGANVGELVVKSLRAERVTTDTLCIGTTCLTEAELQELMSSQNVDPADDTEEEQDEEVPADETPIVPTDPTEEDPIDETPVMEEPVVDESPEEETPVIENETPAEEEPAPAETPAV